MNRRVEPIVGRNFQVTLEVRGPRGGLRDEVELGFSQVVIPPLRLDARGRISDRDQPPPQLEANQNLVLRRGHTGSSRLFELWKLARDREPEQVRDVFVTLLDESLKPVTAWHFAGCHVVSLDYTPLDALDVDVLYESLELSFKVVEQIEV